MPKELDGITSGSLIPDFSLISTDGEVYSSQRLKGTPFLLYFLRGIW
ncbi:hypothetical protein RZN22_11565 [Bacillaceae bacterium S4-13-58]